MPSERDIKHKFWKTLKAERTFMLGLADESGGDAQPMTAIIEDDDGGPIWIFSAKDVDLVQAIGPSHEASAQFVSKGHDLFASIHGTLTLDNNRAVIDRLWNGFIAAWYEGGKDDPKLQLLRFDADRAHIWLNENSAFAGVKLLLGADPKKEYKDKTADVPLN